MMRLTSGNLACEIFRKASGRYHYTIYKLLPDEEAILVGERSTLREAMLEAENYMKLTATAWARGEVAC